MASQVQYRRGTNAQNAAFTGALAEITVDTTNGTLRVHDGITAGGSNIATVSYVTSQISALSSNSISFGTSNVRVVSSGGNVATSVGGTANVVVVATTGEFVTGLISATGAITGAALTGTSMTVSTGNITGGNLILSGAIEDSAQLDIRTTASNANIVFTPNGTGNVNTGANVSVTGRVTAASVVGGVMTGSSVSVTGAVTGASVVGGVMTGSSLSVTGTINGTTLTGTSLTVSTGNITGGNIVNANANGVGNIGSATTYFNTVFAKATSAQYADLAENYLADSNYPPGTVVEFGGTAEITQSTCSHSTRVAGIVSTNPSYLMNATQTGDHVLPVALTGRVPCQVVGHIAKGDRLVASDQPGVATLLDMTQYQPACIIGKALEAYNSEIVGTIEVAVGRT
jgi:hypothetical protein